MVYYDTQSVLTSLLAGVPCGILGMVVAMIFFERLYPQTHEPAYRKAARSDERRLTSSTDLRMALVALFGMALMTALWVFFLNNWVFIVILDLIVILNFAVHRRSSKH